MPNTPKIGVLSFCFIHALAKYSFHGSSYSQLLSEIESSSKCLGFSQNYSITSNSDAIQLDSTFTISNSTPAKPKDENSISNDRANPSSSTFNAGRGSFDDDDGGVVNYYSSDDDSNSKYNNDDSYDPFSVPPSSNNDYYDPFSVPPSSYDPFDPFSVPPSTSVSTIAEDPFSLPAATIKPASINDDPISSLSTSRIEDDPFSPPSSKIEDDPFSPSSSRIEDDPFSPPSSRIEDDPFSAPSNKIEDDPFWSPSSRIEDDPFSPPSNRMEDDPFSTPSSRVEDENDPFSAAVEGKIEEDPFSGPSVSSQIEDDPFSGDGVTDFVSDSIEIPSFDTGDDLVSLQEELLKASEQNEIDLDELNEGIGATKEEIGKTTDVDQQEGEGEGEGEGGVHLVPSDLFGDDPSIFDNIPPSPFDALDNTDDPFANINQ